MEHDSFQYTYSAPQQEEIKRIRAKYTPREEDKLETLRRLDESAARKGTSAALAVGILGTLVMGLGMSCCMVWGGSLFLPGLLLGLLGIAGVIAALPLYQHITKKERERIAPEILRLTDELLK